MRSLASYTRVILKGSYCSKGYNSTSAPLSRVVTTNTEYLRPRRPPSPQPADIPSADIPSADIPFVDIPFASQTKTSKEKKVNIIKNLL